MTHGKGKREERAKTRPRYAPPTPGPRLFKVTLQKVDADDLHKLEVEREHNQMLVCRLTGLASEVREIKRLITEPPPTDSPRVENFNLERVDAIKIPSQEATKKRGDTSIETELHMRSHIGPILEDMTKEVSKMLDIFTVSRTPSDELIIQEEIMIRLPVKSLARFRCVSRSWKCLIDSPEFLRAHKNQAKHLLVTYIDRDAGGERLVCFADDDSLRANFPALPPPMKRPHIVGSCYGLVCFKFYDSYGKEMAVIWNPCIRKSIAVHVPPRDGVSEQVPAFAVCPVTLDPTIVRIAHLCPPGARRPQPDCYKHWKVQVYKLSCGKFRNLSVTGSNLPGVSKRITRDTTHVIIDRLIYWYAQVDLEDATARNLIMSFDVTDEKFEELQLPNTLASLRPSLLDLAKRRESLLILEFTKSDSYHVWKMEGRGVFRKLFNINSPPGSLTTRLLGFRNMGGPIMVVEGSESTQLVAYDEPNSEKHTHLLLSSDHHSYTVDSYMESLLLIARTSY